MLKSRIYTDKVLKYADCLQSNSQNGIAFFAFFAHSIFSKRKFTMSLAKYLSCRGLKSGDVLYSLNVINSCALRKIKTKHNSYRVKYLRAKKVMIALRNNTKIDNYDDFFEMMRNA